MFTKVLMVMRITALLRGRYGMFKWRCTMGTCQLTSAIVFNSDMGYPCPDHTQNTVMMMINVAVYCRKSEDIITVI